MKTRTPCSRSLVTKCACLAASRVAVMAVLTFCDPSPAASDILTADERAWLQAHGPLRYAPHVETPPFESIRGDGQVAGIVPEFLAIVARNLGVEIKPVRFATWTEAVEGTRRGEADLLALIRPTPERDKFLLFTRPFLDVQNVLFVNRATSDLRGFAALRGRRVGVVRDYAEFDWLRTYHPEVSIVPVATTREGLLMLALGQLDAMFDTLQVGHHLIAENSLTQLQALPQVFYTTPNHMAVVKDDARLLNILQKGLDSVTEAERRAILAKWTGQLAAPGWRMPDWVWQGSLALLACLGLVTGWNYSLRRRVARQMEQIREQVERETVLERRCTDLVENATDIVYILDPEGNFTSVNPAMERLLGYSREEALRLNLAQIVVPEHRELVRRQTTEILAGDVSTTYEMDVMTKDGRRRTLEVGTRLMRGKERSSQVEGIARDITERKQAELALRESEQRFRLMTQAVPSMTFECDASGTNTFSSDQWCVYTGLTPEESLGMGWAKAIHPEDLADSAARWSEAMRTGTPCELHHRVRAVDGAYRWFLLRLLPMRDTQGRIMRWAGSMTDIHSMMEVEAALREQARFVSTVAGNSPDFITVFDCEQQRYVYRNKELPEFLGFSPYEAKAMADDMFSRLLFPEDTLRFRAHYAALMHAADGEVLTLEYRMRTRAGECAWFLARDAVFKRDAAGRVIQILSVAQDITDQKRAGEARVRLEAELRHSQKMEAVGELAGGVAHDFNNLLTVIMGNTSLLAGEQGLSAQAREVILQITGAARRAADLTRQLLTFSRRQVMQIHPLDLNLVLDGITTMLRRLLGEHIALQCNYGPDLPSVEADAGMLEQVVVNLAVNARDAMSGGGRLTLTTRAETLGTDYAQHNPEGRPGRFVSLSVTDTGCGINVANLTRIFEPFFTTKDVGKGSGLGLATSYGIVKQHNGWIEVASQLGRGSTFKIYLPAAGVKAAAGVPSAESDAGMAGGSETILLVEDDPSVLTLARRCLQRCGYRVIEASNGHAALRVWQERGSEVDLLITDMVMPGGMSGRDLAGRLRADRPDLKVIFSSGYNPEIMAAEPKPPMGDHHLSKPYNASTLARAVRQRLDDS